MEQKRICTLCNIIKPFSEFNWDKRFNIPFSRCKPCFNEKCKQYRYSQQGKKVYSKWAKGNGKIVRSNAIKKWRQNNPHNRNAHTAVSNAVRDGRLIKHPCIKCGDIKTEAHHESYKKEDWLKVIWLCKKHHTEVTYSSI